VTPDAIRSQLSMLREAGAELRRRPPRYSLESLSRVLDGWSDPGSAWREALVRDLPDATGFTAETVREGLRIALESWNGDALRRLVRSELGEPDAADGSGEVWARGFDATTVLLAGSIPMPTLLSLVAPLVLRSPVLAKCASRDPVTAHRVATSIREIDPLLGACIAVVDVPGDDEAAVAALLEAECVVATGSDETIATIARRVPAEHRLVSAGHRLSIALLGEEVTRGESLRRACEGLALDVAVWDQQGCLSPIAIYAVGRGAGDRVLEALAEALDRAETRWPRGRVDLAAAAALDHERAAAELRRAGGQPVAIRVGSAWTLVREADTSPRPAPLHRFLRIHPLEDLDALPAAIAPLSSHLAGAAVAGLGAREEETKRHLVRLGASRICAPGQLQAPPLDWRREGRGILVPLTRAGAR
jgi:hypothetical protein